MSTTQINVGKPARAPPGSPPAGNARKPGSKQLPASRRRRLRPHGWRERDGEDQAESRPA